MNISFDSTKGKRKRGFALMFVMAFAAVITVFTASVGAQASYNLRLANNRGESDRAYYAAQTGTQLILSMLREPPPFADYDGDGVDGAWLAEDGSLNLAFEATKSRSIARVFHNIRGFPNPTPTAPDGTTIPPDHFYIVSLGVVNGVYDAGGNLQAGTTFEANTMGATLNPAFPITPYAIFGYNSINVDGAVAHFDSRSPNWQISGTGTAPNIDHMDCMFPEASVGVSQTAESAVTIGDNAEIDGHIIFGLGTGHGEREAERLDINANTAAALPATAAPIAPGTTFTFGASGAVSVTGGQSHINGSIDEVLSDNPAFDPDKTVAVANLSGSIGALVLEEGRTYVKVDDLTVSASDSIRVNDTNGDGLIEDVLLIVEGDVQFTNATIGAIDVTAPRNLKIYAEGTVFNMDNSEAFCLVAGRDLQASITGNSTLWGAIIGDSVTLEDGSAVHYDEVLRDPLLIADIYDHYLVGANIASGAKVATVVLGPPVPPAAAPAPAPAPVAAPATAAPPAAATTAGCGCGCGCGCGSMLMMNKL